jgi:hypothetical protein
MTDEVMLGGLSVEVMLQSGGISEGVLPVGPGTPVVDQAPPGTQSHEFPSIEE